MTARRPFTMTLIVLCLVLPLTGAILFTDAGAPLAPTLFSAAISGGVDNAATQGSSDWQIETVDSAGNVGDYCTSLVLDAEDYPHISYFDRTKGDLKYAHWDGSAWQIEMVDSLGSVQLDNSLALDAEDYPHISYFDQTKGDLKYAHWDGLAWQIETVDSTGHVGEFTSLALNEAGHPHISYYDRTKGDLKYAHWDGLAWQIETVDSAGNVGDYSSLELDGEDYPHISYLDRSNGDLKYAYWDGSQWHIEAVDSVGSVGWYTSLALDGEDYPHISYFAYYDKDLKYAHWDGSTWQIETVDSTGYVGEWTSLAVDIAGHPHISYYDNTNNDLKYAHWDGSTWQFEIVDSSGFIGEYSSLALDEWGNPHISYYDRSNKDLKYARRSGPAGWIRLTTNPGDDGGPTWSPDGTRIAYMASLSRGGWNREIWDMNPDGTGHRQLTTLGVAGMADYSPDGSKILFCHYHNDCRFDIVVMNADGTDITPIITSRYNQNPRWSPCGDKIAFASGDCLGSPHDVYVANVDGTGITQLTFLGTASYPVWSPDCSEIAFSADPDLDGQYDIYVMDATDRTILAQLTDDPYGDNVWDWFGNKILFYSNRVGGQWHIFMMDEDGTDVMQLTDSTGIEAAPRFSPDGTKIVFMADVEGNEDIYVKGIALEDTTGPSISSVVESDDPIYTTGCPEPTTVTITATITDFSGVDHAWLYHRLNGGSWEYEVMSASGDDYSATIGPFAEAGTVEYYIEAWDEVGNSSTSSSYTVTVNECAGPSIVALPSSLPADGVSTCTITLLNAPARHLVRVLSSRGSVDTFTQVSGTTDASGCFVTTVHSSTPGTVVITAEDLSTGRTFATSAALVFTPVGGEPLPPQPQTHDPIITSVEGNCEQIDCPIDGFFMLGLDGLHLPLQVSVDWRGQPMGSVEFSLNGHTDSIAATGQNVSYELDINRHLREPSNILRIIAHSGDKSSVPFDLPLFGYRLPQWIMDGVNTLPAIGNQALVLEITLPPQPLCKHEQGRNECEDIRWGFLSGDLNRFQWQTNIKMSLPTRGGAFEVEISRERDRATTGRKPQAFLKLIGHECDLEYHGRLSGVLGAKTPYVVVQELEIGGSVAREFEKDVGVVEALNALPPFGTAAYASLSAVPPIRDWLNDRAKFYIKITPELSGEFTLAFQPHWHIADVQAGLDFPLELGAQADLWVVEGCIYGGLGGKGTLGYSADEVYIGSLQAYGFGGYTFRVTWFSLEGRGDWKLAEWPSGSGRVALTFLVPVEAPPTWHLIGHNASPTYATFQALPGRLQAFGPAGTKLSMSGLAAQSTVTSVLVSNVYTYPVPSLAVEPATDKSLLVWVHDDVAKPVGQAHEIAFSRWNGSSWSTPASVTDDYLLDDAPQVAWASDGHAVAVWERLNDTLPITATWNVTTAKKIEIATSAYSPTVGTWSVVSLLTTNTALDFTPQLARSGTGNLLAVWRENPAGLLAGTAADPDRIMAAFYDEGWGIPAVAVEGIPGLVDLAAGSGDGVATIAYTRYLTPTGYPTPTLQLFTSTWNGAIWSSPVQRTDDRLGHRSPQVVYNGANQPLVIWVAGDELRLHNLTTGSIVSLTLESGAVIDEFRVVQDGTIAAVFTAQNAQRDLHLALYDQAHHLWGRPLKLTDDRAAEACPSAGLDSAGRLLVAYAARAITSITHTMTISGTGEVVTYTLPTEGQTDLLLLSHVFTRNLTLESDALSVSDLHPAPGSTIVLSATVLNSGDLALDGVVVSFYDGDPTVGGMLIGTSDLSVPLAAGFTSTLTTTYNVPVTGGVHILFAVADPAHVITESNEADNTVSLAAFGPDLEITNAGVDYWGGSDVGVRALIRNIGTSSAPTTTLTFYRDSVTGTLAVTDAVPALAAGEAITLTTPWSFGPLSRGVYPLVGIVNRGDFTETFTSNNLYTFMLDVRPDLMVSPYYLWTTSPTATTVLVTATVYNIGAITATDVLVGFYGDDRLKAGSTLLTQTIPLLAPAGSATVSGQIAGPLACTLYAYVDPDRAITETTRANNVAGITYRGLCRQVYIPLILRNP